MNSDFKNNRVSDPTKVSEKQVKQIKKYCKEYFDKAVVKQRAYEKKKAEKKARDAVKSSTEDSKDEVKNPELLLSQETQDIKREDESDVEDDLKMSDDEMDKVEDKKSSPMSVDENSLKRKRGADSNLDADIGSRADSPCKRTKSATPPPSDSELTPGKDGVEERSKLKREEQENGDGYKSDSSSPGKRQRSLSPPPPPPPPPPADTYEMCDVGDGSSKEGTELGLDEDGDLHINRVPSVSIPDQKNGNEALDKEVL